MPTPEELLEALETRLVLGEISEVRYDELKAKFLAQLEGGGGSSASGRMNVSDSVIKGDVSSTTGAASVGSVVFNVPGSEARGQSGPSLVVCPACGRRNPLKDTFKCVKCGTDHLCLKHLVDSAMACEECVAKDESLRAEAERKRRVEQEAADAETREKAKAHAPKNLGLDCGNGVAMKLILIPPGDFLMGSPDTEDGAAKQKPQHRVTITRSFYMGVYPVTQAQYQAVTGWNSGSFEGDSNPVESVIWSQAEEFCGALSARTGRSVRLPTEAEWEYACRAGTTTRFSFGDEKAMLGRFAWFDGNSGEKTHPVGQKQPNPWGLYDMHGNVWEWCADWYANSYANAGDTDPLGPSSGSERVLRGGSWRGPLGRIGLGLASKLDCVGFRVVVDLE